MLAKLAISVKLPKIALSSTAGCVLYRYGQARTSPTPPLTHLRFDGILLCEADGRCRDKGATGTKKEAQAGQDNDTNPRHRARWKRGTDE